jgi:hypothetical protein
MTARDRLATVEVAAVGASPRRILVPGGLTTIERGFGSAFATTMSASNRAKITAADAVVDAEDTLVRAQGESKPAATIAKLQATFTAADAAATALGV